jgi:branched-chain amino acid transport system ATP-binding protein
MLEIRNLTGGWGPTTIVEDVSVTLANGETMVLIGRNGVGKSTLLELITNRARRVSGAVRLNGEDISALPTHERARRGLGYVPQQREVFASLTVKEHMAIAQQPGRWSESAVLELFPSLNARMSSKGSQLSGGEQQMLAIARALLGNPSVLLMDEPSEGLAPIVVEQLVHAMRALADDGSLSILLVEQRIDVALDLATRYLIMDRGRVVYSGPTADLRMRPEQLPQMMGLES